MVRLLRGSLLKLVRRPASRMTLAVLLGLLALVYMAVGASAVADPAVAEESGVGSVLGFPEAYGSLGSMLLNFAGLAAAAYAGAIAASEWSWNMFRVAVARGASRPGYIVATFGAVALLALLAWVVAYAAGVGLALGAATVSGIAVGDPLDGPTLGRLPILVIAGWWSVVMGGAIGFAVAFAARNAVAGIAAVVVLTFGEQFAGVVVPQDIVSLAPISASSRLTAEAMATGLSAELVGPLVLTTLYLVLAIAAAGLVAQRAEVA